MKRAQYSGILGIFGLMVALGWASPAVAQFSSGSTGALGAFNPPSSTTVTLPADGILNYTTVTISSGVTVTFTPNAANTPVTMLATGDVTITGTINIDGAGGQGGTPTAGVIRLGGAGGPGGFPGGSGGQGGTTNAGSNGVGPGGGAGSTGFTGAHGTYGAAVSFVSLIPLVGGSGGGGSTGTTAPVAGSAGGGGAGGIVIASSTKITVNGSILARGGGGGIIFINPNFHQGGSGSGGAIRLVAPQVTGTGALNTEGSGAVSDRGRIRVEATTLSFTGPSTPAFTSSAVLGPITPASTPPLVNFPTLKITSVGGTAMPSNPVGSLASPDVTLPAGTTNPVSVIATATNTPVPTTFTFQLFTPSGAIQTTTVASTGTTQTSTATATTINFPSGTTSVLLVFGNFTIPINFASLFPLIDGEPAEQILLAAAYGEPSTMTLVAKSGKELPVSQLSQADQLKVAMAFEVMQTSKQ